MPRSQRETAIADTSSLRANSVWLKWSLSLNFSIRTAHSGLASFAAVARILLDTRLTLTL